MLGSTVCYMKPNMQNPMEKEKKNPNDSLINIDDQILRWVDELDENLEETYTISSEDESESADQTERSNSTPVQELWNPKILWAELMCLPDAQELNDFILKEDIDEIIKRDKRTSLLICSWIGGASILKLLLNDYNVPPDTIDNSARTALHLAAYSGKYECTRILLESGANPNAWDGTHQVTPLHCAAAAGHVNCLRVLLRHGADANAGINQRSALHYAVQSMSAECVKELLDHNALPNTSQVYSETPLHVAATVGNASAVRLLLERGASVNVQYGINRSTPLHLAAEHADVKCASLLLDAGANVAALNRKLQTPLHLAALAQCSETMEILLSKGANPNCQDLNGRTPLHCSTVNVQRSCECVRLLLDSGADVNLPDLFGYTPMHLAALNEFSPCLMLFLGYGGDVTRRTNGGISVLNFITKKTPEVMPKYIEKFDASIQLNDREIGDVDCQLKLDFRILVPTMGHQETALLLNFIDVGHKQILTHPLCETFLYLKWRRIRKFFLFSLLYQSIFVTLLTLYVIGVFLKDCPPIGRRLNPCTVPLTVVNIGFGVVILNSLILIKEVFQICQSWRTYIREWENWLQWLIIVTVYCIVNPFPNMNIRTNVYSFQHHLAAIGIFLAWVELMMIVGRFPAFGLYVQMFTTVSLNFVKFMMAYFCLFIAFALSFGVIFANYPSFQDLKWTLLKVIVMMSGELEYEDIFFPNKDKDNITVKDRAVEIKYPYTAHLMFMCFVLLVTVILTNLMVGLAVSDIQGLQQSAGLDRLVRLSRLMAHLEGILFSKLLKWVPSKLMQFLHRKALLLRSQRDWTLEVRPNDPREGRIPKELIQNIYQLVASRKDRPRSKKFRKSVISPPLSRYSSYNSSFRTRNKRQKLENKWDEKSKDLAEDIQKMVRQHIDDFLKQI